MVVTVCNVTLSFETTADLVMVKLQGTGSSLMDNDFRSSIAVFSSVVMLRELTYAQLGIPQ